MASVSFINWARPNAVASYVSNLYDTYQSYRTVNRSKWEELEAYLFATDTTSLKGGSAHDHTTHIPIIADLKEELEAIMYAAVLPHDDFLHWTPFTLDAAAKTVRSKVKAYIKNRHSLNGFDKTFRKLLQDLVIYGNCFTQVVYVDERVNGVGYVGPKPIRISPYDIVFDPTRSEFSKTPKITRAVMTMGEFLKFAEGIADVNPEVITQMKERRTTVTALSRTEINKGNQYTPDGFTDMMAYYKSGVVEVLTFYGDVYDEETQEVRPNRCVIVVDRVALLAEYDEPYPHIYKGSWAEKPDSLWSQGPLDKVVGLNYQINHRENSKSDALDRFIYPDKVYIGDVEEIYDESTGQTKYLAPEGGGVQDIIPDTTVLTADMHQDRLMMHARAAAGLPPQLMGFRTPGEKTAFEVQNLDDAALRKFLHKAAQFEMELLEPVVRAEIMIGNENFSSVIQALSNDEDGIPMMLSITKEDLSANGKLVPVGARRFARQNQQIQAINMLANSNLGQLIGQHINTFNLARVVEELGAFDDFQFIDKFAAIQEQGEAQFEQAMAEQNLVRQLEQPGLDDL